LVKKSRIFTPRLGFDNEKSECNEQRRVFSDNGRVDRLFSPFHVFSPVNSGVDLGSNFDLGLNNFDKSCDQNL